MANTGPWISETTATVGTGVIVLGGKLDTFTTFGAAVPVGKVWYSIEDSNGNRESGIGDYNGTTNITRSDIHATIVGGIFDDDTPTAIPLSGDAVISCTMNARAYQELDDHIGVAGNPHGTTAAMIPYDSSQDPITNFDTVQEAMLDQSKSIEELSTVKIGDAPADGSPYNRQDNTWVVAGAGAGGGIGEAPIDGQNYVRKDASWVAQSPSGAPVDSVFGRTGIITAEVGDYSSFYATVAQGAKADSALQDLTSTSINELQDITITSPVNGNLLSYQGGIWVNRSYTSLGLSIVGHTHTKSDITDFNDADYATAAQGTKADTALQSGNNVSLLANDSGYLADINSESIGDLSDVDLTAISSNGLLVWDGSKFVASNIITDSNKDSKATSGDDVSELVPFITPATVANQFSIPATVKYIDGLRVDIPETLITLPAAPDGLDKLDGTGRYADLAAAITAGGNDLTQSVITRQDVVVYDVTNAQYVVHQGLREYSGMVDAMTAFSYTQDPKDKNLWRDALGNLFVMICHPQRLNQGGYHPEYNSSGCSFFWNADNVSNTGWLWHDSLAKKPANKSECFALSATNGTGNFVRADRGDIAGGVSGRPSVWETQYFDAIYAILIHDVRASCNRKTPQEILDSYGKKAIADDIRGREGVPFTTSRTTITGNRYYLNAGNTYAVIYVDDVTLISVSLGDVMFIQDATEDVILQGKVSVISVASDFIRVENPTVISGTETTGSHPSNEIWYLIENLLSPEFGTLPYQDIVGHPERIKAIFPDGVYGQWVPHIIVTAPEIYPHNRKALSAGTWVHTLDDGVTFNAGAVILDSVNNSYGLSLSVNSVLLTSYETKANPYELANNAVVAGEVGDVQVMYRYTNKEGNGLLSGLLGKVAIGNTALCFPQQVPMASSFVQGDGLFSIDIARSPTHLAPLLDNPNGSPVVKVFSYLTVENGQYFLQWVYKEMYWDVTLDNGVDFTDRIESETTATVVGEYYHLINGRFQGWYRAVASTSVAFSDIQWGTDSKGNIIYTDGVMYMEKWDGNGFGDNNKFTVIDGEGVEPDENGNTVIVGQKRTPLPYFTGE